MQCPFVPFVSRGRAAALEKALRAHLTCSGDRRTLNTCGSVAEQRYISRGGSGDSGRPPYLMMDITMREAKDGKESSLGAPLGRGEDRFEETGKFAFVVESHAQLKPVPRHFAVCGVVSLSVLLSTQNRMKMTTSCKKILEAPVSALSADGPPHLP